MKTCTTSEQPCRMSRCIGMAVLIAVCIAILGWVVMQLWNWLMPELFVGAHTVNYCQALGILLLSKILFGSWRCCSSRYRERRMHWESMTPEEREQLKERLHSRWGNWCCGAKQDESAVKNESSKTTQQ